MGIWEILDATGWKIEAKGPVKLKEWMEIAHLFLHVTSKLLQFTVLNLPG